MKIRSWDKVQVMSWKEKDKWHIDEVLKVFPDTNKVLVKWVNIVKRHLKRQWTNPGQIIEIEKPISVSSVMLVCPFTDKPTRIGFVKIEEKWKQKKFRFSKKALKEKWGEAKSYIIK
jgi:large subunit ribosomal protein L24